jgi:hypothetical protein
VNGAVPEILALVPTKNLHSLRNDKTYWLLGTRTAIFLSRHSDCWIFSSFTFNIKVS